MGAWRVHSAQGVGLCAEAGGGLCIAEAFVEVGLAAQEDIVWAHRMIQIVDPPRDSRDVVR